MRHTGKREMIADSFHIKAPKTVEAELKNDGETVLYNGNSYKLNKEIICILFMGIDKTDSSKESDQIGSNHQSDVISLCAIDSVNKKITLFNVPRDIITDVNVYSPSGGFVGVEKLPIGVSYAYGDGKETSCHNTSTSVSRLFYNLPIKTYYSLNLDGVADVNDSLGGVDVVSPETIDMFEKGKTYHLSGSEATRFVHLRVRDRADANLLRNERQKVYLNAIIKKFFAATRKDIGVPISVFNATQGYSCTNLNPDRITYLATEFIINRDMKVEFKSVPVDVKQVDNHAENYVKEKDFFELFLSVFYNKAS